MQGLELNEESLRSRSRARKRLRDDPRSLSTATAGSTSVGGSSMDVEDGSSTAPSSTKKRKRSVRLSQERNKSQGRSKSVTVKGMTLHSDRSRSRVAGSIGRPELQEQAEKKKRKLTAMRNIEARKGEGDRHIPDFKPKHLFSGKRTIGKTDRR